MNRNGSVATVVVFVVLALIVAGGIAWVHYDYLPHVASESTSTASAVSTSSVSVPAIHAVVTSTVASATPKQVTVPVTSQNKTPSAAVPTSWGQGKFSFTAPITGCFAFKYPPTFSSGGESYSDNGGDTFDYTVALAQNVNLEWVVGFYKQQGYAEKDFTTRSGFPIKEFALKNRTTIFDIFIPGSQQLLINLNFSHDSRMPPSSLDLGTEEAIAQSVVFPCPSQ